ncbi:MAG: 4Fe-4S binding protein [Candidatus Bathyarchaeia archaeon]
MNLHRLRTATQTLFFLVSNLGFSTATKTGLCYPFLYCYGCPLASAACPIGTLQQFVIIPAIPLYLLGSLGLYGALFGRAFCGWACPFGAFQDLLGSFSQTKRKLRPFKYSKFVMPIIVIAVAWFTLDTFFCKFCPAGSLFAAIPAPFFFPALSLGVFFYVHIATLVLTVILVLLFSRFWCRYLCPVAPIGIFNRFSVFTVSLDETKCHNCQECLDVCPMELKEMSDIGRSSDCLLCGRCVEACGSDALQMRLRGH